MAGPLKKPDYGDSEASEQRIRIILCSKNVKDLEKGENAGRRHGTDLTRGTLGLNVDDRFLFLRHMCGNGSHAVCTNLVESARENEMKVKGPIRMPTKVLRVTTRKSPCGEGTNTWDRFEMRIHKRVVDFHATSDAVMQITKVTLEPGVVVDVNVN